MGSPFHQLCPRYSGTLTPTATTAIRLWETFTFNPIALRKAKIAYNFGLSECSRVKTGLTVVLILCFSGVPVFLRLHFISGLSSVDHTRKCCDAVLRILFGSSPSLIRQFGKTKLFLYQEQVHDNNLFYHVTAVLARLHESTGSYFYTPV